MISHCNLRLSVLGTSQNSLCQPWVTSQIPSLKTLAIRSHTPASTSHHEITQYAGHIRPIVSLAQHKDIAVFYWTHSESGYDNMLHIFPTFTPKWETGWSPEPIVDFLGREGALVEGGGGKDLALRLYFDSFGEEGRVGVERAIAATGGYFKFGSGKTKILRQFSVQVQRHGLGDLRQSRRVLIPPFSLLPFASSGLRELAIVCVEGWEITMQQAFTFATQWSRECKTLREIYLASWVLERTRDHRGEDVWYTTS